MNNGIVVSNEIVANRQPRIFATKDDYDDTYYDESSYINRVDDYYINGNLDVLSERGVIGPYTDCHHALYADYGRISSAFAAIGDVSGIKYLRVDYTPDFGKDWHTIDLSKPTGSNANTNYTNFGGFHLFKAYYDDVMYKENIINAKFDIIATYRCVDKKIITNETIGPYNSVTTTYKTHWTFQFKFALKGRCGNKSSEYINRRGFEYDNLPAVTPMFVYEVDGNDDEFHDYVDVRDFTQKNLQSIKYPRLAYVIG